MKLSSAQAQQYFTDNREAWNKRTAIHKNSAMYDLPAFKAGKSTLNPLELAALGDVAGKSLLHLQCHFGLDSLSWTRLGAYVTGVDISNDAIALAESLSEELGLPANFICCNVYDLPTQLRKQYDIIVTTYGTIGWLPDIDLWASVIALYLKPGGIFFIAEFHPFLWMMDNDFKEIKHHYNNVETITENTSGTYTNRSADIHYTEHSWNHSLSEVMTALLKHGLQIQEFQELPYSYYNCFNNTVQGEDSFWRIQGLEDKLPMMYAIKAVKSSMH